jgi:hypothetical protein
MSSSMPMPMSMDMQMHRDKSLFMFMFVDSDTDLDLDLDWHGNIELFEMPEFWTSQFFVNPVPEWKKLATLKPV